MITTLLLDLDDTLMLEVEAASSALLDTATRFASAHGVDPGRLVSSVRRHAAALWTAGPKTKYCDAIGISSWEGLAGDFSGDGPELCALREWVPVYRVDAWSRGLEDNGIRSDVLAKEMALAYIDVQPGHWRLFPEARAALEDLRGEFRLGLLTNGAPAIQRGKVAATGIGGPFDAVIVSGEEGVGKPEPEVFRIALQRMGASPAEAVMVGNSIPRDIVGAQHAGVRAIWMNRGGPGPTAVTPDGEIATLDELRPLLEAKAW